MIRLSWSRGKEVSVVDGGGELLGIGSARLALHSSAYGDADGSSRGVRINWVIVDFGSTVAVLTAMSESDWSGCLLSRLAMSGVCNALGGDVVKVGEPPRSSRVAGSTGRVPRGGKRHDRNHPHQGPHDGCGLGTFGIWKFGSGD